MDPLRIATLASLAIVASCSKSESSSGTSTTTTQITQAARDAFKARCAPCHGETGQADGPAVVKLDTKPPNFGGVVWQKRVTDEEIRKAILHGGAAVGKSPAMPASGDLEGKPDLLDGLLAIIRSFNGT